MAFVRKLVGPDEHLIGIARLHWIYGVKGLMWLGGFLLLGGFINHLIIRYIGYSPASNPAFSGVATLGASAFWICLLIGLCLFLFYFIMMIATEVGLTSKRLIFKKGLIFVDVKEVDLEEIKGGNVDNGVLGRLFNYGTVNLDARFVHDMSLPFIADPYRFLKALNETRTLLKEDSMHIVLEEKGQNMKKAVRHALNQEREVDAHDPDPAEEGNPNRMEDSRYKTFDDVEPMAMFTDIRDEIRESEEGIKQNQLPQSANTSRPFRFRPRPKIHNSPGVGDSGKQSRFGPIVFKSRAELREEVLDDFSQSTTA